MNEMEKLIRDWSQSNGFDRVLNIEGIPLWWFYRRYFTSHVMPGRINPFKFMEKNIPLSIKDKAKYSLNAKLLEKYLNFNENRKIRYFKPKNEYSAEEKILFLTYTNHLIDGELFRFQRMIDKLKRDGKYKDLVLFADPLSSSGYKRLAGRSTFYEYYDDNISIQAKFDAELWFKQWKMIDEKIKREIFMINGKSLWPYLKYPFSFYFSEEFFYFLSLYYRISKKIIEQENIKAIVVSSQSGFFEKCMLAAALKKNIQVFQIQHGMGSGMLENTYATKRLVFSEFHKQELIGSGVSEEDIIITGPIVFDEIADFKSAGKEKNILIAASPYVEGNVISKEEHFSKINMLVDALKDFKVIIKLHPREKHFNDYPSKVKVLKDISRKEFYQLISECSVFINFGSTAAFEAIIMDKPVITIDIAGIMNSPLKEVVCTLLFDSQASINLDRMDGIKEIIVKAIDDVELALERKKFVEKYCYKLDGKASERGVEAIYDLIGNLNSSNHYN